MSKSGRRGRIRSTEPDEAKAVARAQELLGKNRPTISLPLDMSGDLALAQNPQRQGIHQAPVQLHRV